MDTDQQTSTQAAADAFFTALTGANPTQLARLDTERGGNLAAVVAEQQAFGYWDRTIAERRARQQAAAAAPDTAAARDAARTAHPDESVRRPAPAALTDLPERRTTALDDEDRRATDRWWRALASGDRAGRLARRLLREARNADTAAQRAVLHARRAAIAWQAEQRAFERAQWRAVLQQQADRRRRRVTNRWMAIDEQRALEIAAAVLARRTPPQGAT